MKLSDVLIKPILSEKANKQSEKMNRYAFVVDRKANKLEIKRAVELFYGVQVEEVNTLVMPSKLKAKYTKAGFIVGRKPAKKKALFVIPEYNDNMYLSLRNVEGVNGSVLSDMNTYDILDANVLVMTEKAAKLFTETEA